MTDINPNKIELSKSIDINGTKVSQLSMREPTVEDQLTADAFNGSDSLKEVQLFANLCEISRDAIKSLTLKDYKKLQETFLFFTSD